MLKGDVDTGALKPPGENLQEEKTLGEESYRDVADKCMYYRTCAGLFQGNRQWGADRESRQHEERAVFLWQRQGEARSGSTDLECLGATHS